jgi:hypothetical protein
MKSSDSVLSVEDVDVIKISKVTDKQLDVVFHEFSTNKCLCVKCGTEYVAGDNNLYSCRGHTGELILDTFTTVQNVVIGVAIGAVVGTGFGLIAGLLIVGKAAAVAGTAVAAKGATAGLSTAAAVTSGYTVTSGAAAAGAAGATSTPLIAAGATGAGVGTAVGGAGGTVQSVLPSFGAYKWSCCGQTPGATLCRGRTAMHKHKNETPAEGPHAMDTHDKSDVSSETTLA